MIYFIRNTATGAVKIGHSKAPRRRLGNLQTASDAPLEIIGVTEGDRAAEAEIHERFAGDRRGGEWFSPTKALLTFIAEQSRPVSRDCSKRTRGPAEPMSGREKAFREAFASALDRRLSARGAELALARRLGIDRKTIRLWRQRKTAPGADVVANLIEIYGGEFFNETHGVFGLVASRDEREAAALTAVNRLAPALDALSEMVGAVA